MDPLLIGIVTTAGTTLAGAIGVLWKTSLDAHRQRAHDLKGQLQAALVEADAARKAFDLEREKRIEQVSALADRAMLAAEEGRETMRTILQAIEKGGST